MTYIPYVRGSDTSRAAADSVSDSATTDEARVYAAIVEAAATGRTCDELEVELGLLHQNASARMMGLKKRNLIECRGYTRPTRTGRQAEVWHKADGIIRQEAPSKMTTNGSNWFVGYADTDGVFAQGPTKDAFDAWVKTNVNKVLLPSIAEKFGCNMEWYDLNLAYEKQFSVLIMLGKTRYIARYAHYKGKIPGPDSKPEIKGVEYKRGDSIQLARRFQEKVIRMLLGDWEAPYAKATENIEAYRELIAAQKEYVLTHALPVTEIALSKSLSKPLKDYVVKKKLDGDNASQPPHVVVAKVLAERGEQVTEGTRISYVVADGSDGIKAMPASDYTPGETEIDRYYIWENQVYPPTQRLLEAAFPENEWVQYLKARPPKVRATKAKKGAVPVEQAALFGGVVSNSTSVAVVQMMAMSQEEIFQKALFVNPPRQLPAAGRSAAGTPSARAISGLVELPKLPSIPLPKLPPVPALVPPDSALEALLLLPAPASPVPALQKAPRRRPVVPAMKAPDVSLPRIDPRRTYAILATSEHGDRKTLLALQAVLKAHRGMLPAELHITTLDASRRVCATVIVDLKLSVMPSPQLDAAVEEVLVAARHHR